MVDFQSALLGGGVTLIVVLLIVFAVVGMLFGRLREQLRVVLGKLYSRTSLMLIAIFDVVSAFEPSQTLLGLAVAPIAGIVVWLSEWGLHDKFKKERLAPSLVEGLIAAVIVAIPLPVAGLFVAWFGTVGYKKGGRK
jgi:hypothetical protein